MNYYSLLLLLLAALLLQSSIATSSAITTPTSLRAEEEQQNRQLRHNRRRNSLDNDEENDDRRNLHQQHRSLAETLSCRLYMADYHREHSEKWSCTFERYHDDGVDGEAGLLPYPHTLEIVDLGTTNGVGGNEYNKRALEAAGAMSGKSVLRWTRSGDVAIDEERSTLAVANIAINRRVTIDVENELEEVVDGEQQDDLYIRRHSRRREEERQRNLNLFQQQQPQNANSAYTSATTTIGTKKTLAIRVVGADVAPQATGEDLSRELFGADGSLKSQMADCSGGKLIVEPFEGTTAGGTVVSGGVADLVLSENIKGMSEKQAENAAVRAASFAFGDLANQFDFVMFVMPHGIEPPYAAYAYVGSRLSFYTDEAAEDLSVAMHEIGHNLGLQHAGHNGNEYGDSSGYMGFAINIDTKMCYNAANNYYLGWYPKTSFDPVDGDGSIKDASFVLTGVGMTGYLDGGTGSTGFVDNSGSTTTTSTSVMHDGTFVSLRLERSKYGRHNPQSALKDLFVGYNHAYGANAGTEEDRDLLVIVEKGGDELSSELSWKVATLDVGESFRVENYDGISGKAVTVTFESVFGEDDTNAVVRVLPELFSFNVDIPDDVTGSNNNDDPPPPPVANNNDDPELSPSLPPSEMPSEPPSYWATYETTWYETFPPTGSPTGMPPPTPAEFCKMQHKEKLCNKRKQDGCVWKNDKCKFKKGNVVAPCKSIEKQGDCNGQSGCAWFKKGSNSGKKKCHDAPSSKTCKTNNNKSKCKTKGCAWKGRKCTGKWD